MSQMRRLRLMSSVELWQHSRESWINTITQSGINIFRPTFSVTSPASFSGWSSMLRVILHTGDYPRSCCCYKPSRSFVVRTWRALESAASVNGCSERKLINHLAMTADTQQLRGTTTLSVMGTSCCCSFCEMFKHTKLAVLARTKFVQFCLRDR